MEQRSVICIPRGVLLFLAQQESQMAICYLWAGGCWVTASPGEPSLPGRGRNLPENLSCVFTSACSSIVSFMVTLQPWSFQHGNTVQVLFTSLNTSLIWSFSGGREKMVMTQMWAAKCPSAGAGLGVGELEVLPLAVQKWGGCAAGLALQVKLHSRLAVFSNVGWVLLFFAVRLVNHWLRFSRGAVESPPLEILKSHLEPWASHPAWGWFWAGDS